MLYTNRNYPHPVLGISDDYKSSAITVKLNIEAKFDFFEIRPIFSLKNDDIQVLLDIDNAKYITQVYCRGTMYRDVITSRKSINEPIIISSKKLNGDASSPFISCLLDLPTNE
jgi:hypothetical protein